MRLFVCGLLLLISPTSAITAQNQSPMGGLTLAIKEVKPAGVVTVELNNSSQKPIRIWGEANSWGAAHWRVLLIRDGRLKTFFENPDRMFMRNGPGFNEIAVGGHFERKLDIVGEGWRGPDVQKIRFVRGDVLIVIYDVPNQFVYSEAPISVAASKMGVWYGVATATTVVK
jgi:hypothetical protein